MDSHITAPTSADLGTHVYTPLHSLFLGRVLEQRPFFCKLYGWKCTKVSASVTNTHSPNIHVDFCVQLSGFRGNATTDAVWDISALRKAKGVGGGSGEGSVSPNAAYHSSDSVFRKPTFIKQLHLTHSILRHKQSLKPWKTRPSAIARSRII